MKRSRRELKVGMVIHSDIFQNNKITLFPYSYLLGLIFTVYINVQLSRREL